MKSYTTVHTDPWAKSALHLVVVATCGATISVVMFCVVRHLERSRAEAHFQQLAEQRLSVVRSNVAGALDTISLLAGYFEASGEAGVDRQAFSTFVAPALAKNHYTQALEWIPRVEAAQRSEYEHRAQADLRRRKHLDQRSVETLATLQGLSSEEAPRAVHIFDLTAGMILQEEVRTKLAFLLLVAKGQEVTYPLLMRLRNYHQCGAIADKVLVLVPKRATESCSS
ncbi:MAG: CHASE domain-containing protein [Terriglobales bacterium]